MRISRIKADQAGFYHCMSRISRLRSKASACQVERRMILRDAEKDRMVGMMYNLATFSGIEILTCCFMSNHFHVLVHIPSAGISL